MNPSEVVKKAAAIRDARLARENQATNDDAGQSQLDGATKQATAADGGYRTESGEALYTLTQAAEIFSKAAQSLLTEEQEKQEKQSSQDAAVVEHVKNLMNAARQIGEQQ